MRHLISFLFLIILPINVLAQEGLLDTSISIHCAADSENKINDCEARLGSFLERELNSLNKININPYSDSLLALDFIAVDIEDEVHTLYVVFHVISYKRPNTTFPYFLDRGVRSSRSLRDYAESIVAHIDQNVLLNVDLINSVDALHWATYEAAMSSIRKSQDSERKEN